MRETSHVTIRSQHLPHDRQNVSGPGGHLGAGHRQAFGPGPPLSLDASYLTADVGAPLLELDLTGCDVFGLLEAELGLPLGSAAVCIEADVLAHYERGAFGGAKPGRVQDPVASKTVWHERSSFGRVTSTVMSTIGPSAARGNLVRVLTSSRAVLLHRPQALVVTK